MLHEVDFNDLANLNIVFSVQRFRDTSEGPVDYAQNFNYYSIP